MPIKTVTDTIETYKEKLGAGHRGDRFRVQLQFPANLDTTLLDDASNDFSILCLTAQVPGNKVIETETLNYYGETMKIDSGKGEPEEGTFSFKNTEDMALHQIFKKWPDLIQEKKTGIRSSPEDYKVDNVYIAVLDKEKEPIYQVKLIGFFVTQVATVEVSQEEKTITATEITFSYDRYEDV